ncbi:bifunctional demethylmenaquinone methyltransferase/2-methoxy-6-polyprenyl-1,4-benzoquinol methylase UbiE [uncultured Sunxiuqinia sp.]|jgi:demethylmenaquinone methyltransferase / 2-methoxy-6-polyprenyl-1,4-benzoquinol methylase|uniref:bifunctional demethylmenaquinone methyltransferase/2-methoxy-6-polyprenyl-1,4-benzoquinol methylase UbiE n=1 Tax=uncultured Sunxiuqinia sp. TaxID=1573825 RepID=UPI0030D9AF49|tara:strand:+ start:996 stop:1718 length:723 start_codon:yes stop_codon:yes gene_type:complete
MTVAPYQNSGQNKKQQVEQMFDNIAPKYDFLNHFLSLGIDKLWRKKAVRILKQNQPKRILDVATGTGDFAIAASQLEVDEIVGFDLSEQMIRVGEEKVKKLKLDSLIRFQKGDSEQMPFEDASFDAITVAFGVRNFETLQKGLDEFFRVLRNGGVAIILEFSKPKYFPFKQLYRFYFFHILPFIGGLVSRDSSAYSYLPESVMAFPDDQEMLDILGRTGFSNVSQKRLTFGIATIYVARK